MPNLIGQFLGRYHILEQLGEGGMATVYKAYDIKLETDVAVKVIRKEKLTLESMGKSLKRFEREARTLAKLDHPNIVKVSDYGEYDDIPYLVMPYISGGTVKQRIRQGVIPWPETIRMLIPIARALEYAHQQGVIHRDIKPSNMLLTQAGMPMLSDFGVAKMFELEETSELTGTGMGVGTPEYMAPEQTGRNVDHRVDIYALGIVMYEMLTGRRPYEADTPLAVLIKQASDPLPRLNQFKVEVPSGVERILIKALAKKPGDRFQSMGEMAKALEGITLPKPKPIIEKIKKPEEPKKRINWMMVAGVVISLFVVMAVVFWGGWQMSRRNYLIPAANETPTPTSSATSTLLQSRTLTSTPTLTGTIAPTATEFPVEITDEKGVTMRLVPAGPFIMGSNLNSNEQPVREVTLDDYYMDVYEVTNAQYKACVDTGTCAPPFDLRSNTRSSYYENSRYDNYPVISVTWFQALAYCEWRGSRLPTEAEWEKAARGTDGRIYPWGNDMASSNLLNYNFIVNDVTEVDSYQEGKSPYGMYDMAGNVAEWVNDWYSEDYYQSSLAKNPQGPLNGIYRIIRGGRWNSGAGTVRASSRIKESPDVAYGLLGFRCASSVPTTPTSITSTPQPTPTPAVQNFTEEITVEKGVTMRLVPEGEFLMGNGVTRDDAKPAHMVMLDSYYLDEYEVTNALYVACLDAGMCTPPLNSTYLIPSVANFPVTDIKWDQAKAYCEWRGARLPTEAEWEKAARGIDGRTFPWGEIFNCSKANHGSCTDTVSMVGSYESDISPYGIHDMAGNAEEWVNDWYQDDFYRQSPTANPQGPISGQFRVVRGRYFIEKGYVEGVYGRGNSKPEDSNMRLGFRCARDANP